MKTGETISHYRTSHCSARAGWGSCKRHVLYPGGHVFPFARIEKDTLEWLDTRLGPTQ